MDFYQYLSLMNRILSLTIVVYCVVSKEVLLTGETAEST
jgi:hypothetical protein